MPAISFIFQTSICDPADPAKPARKFAFDKSYWSHDGYKVEEDGYFSPDSDFYADQKKVFDELGEGVLQNAWSGFNSSLFAYGQTGSGKSYSMVGFEYVKKQLLLVLFLSLKGIRSYII